MQLKFEQLDYQIEAINTVISLFQNEPNKTNAFSLTALGGTPIVANTMTLSNDEIGRNLNAVQKQYNQCETQINEQGLNFSIEMETGTGKTYVYLRTIYELNKQYGWQKFVIVVPSVPIREGAAQTIRATKAHFANLFDKPIVNTNVYRSDRSNLLRQFATNNHIEILIMNIDTFKKDGNIINRVNESGEAPILQISQTKPIVIIDEPQNMETDLAKQAIDSLSPLFVLRYSATHKNPYHKIYSLNPIDAYNKKLVKQIEVAPVLAKNDNNGAYVVLKEFVKGKKQLTAKVEIHVQTEKETKKKIVTIKSDDDLFEKSGNNESYRNGFIVNGLDAEKQQIAFSNGQIITQGEENDLIRDEVMKKQIEATIQEHLAKEKRLKSKGIKVLSLFFIDKVANYRGDGKFARWFKEIYERETGESADGVHDGYFSQDKDTNGKTKADDDTYDLIMRDKEKLLSFESPLRFIFSHSALKEGWDNPNVFQICTLNETRSPIKKRQEIGRGLRLAVNQQGERIRDESVNILTVIPNESYESFAANLQKEYEDECGIKFANGGAKEKSKRLHQTYRKGFTLDPNFLEIWQKLQHKTRYCVNFDSSNLIASASELIGTVPKIPKPKITIQKAKLRQNEKDGIWVEEVNARHIESESSWDIPDVLQEIQRKTKLTRSTIYQILQKSGRISEIGNNPQLFIDLISEKILQALHHLMIDGIEYSQSTEMYDQSLIQWRQLEQNGTEFFLNEYTFEVNQSDHSKQQKTIVANYIALDSETEKAFARDCENHEDVRMYFKLPRWFKIPTPIGSYSPDWAIVMNNRSQIYFIAETKNTGEGILNGVDESRLNLNEMQKIKCARKHFDLDIFKGTKYCVVNKLSEIV